MKEDYTIIDNHKERDITLNGLLLICLWSALPTILLIFAIVMYNIGAFSFI